MSKKILSVLLAALMLFSVMPFALAAKKPSMTISGGAAMQGHTLELTLEVADNPGMNTFTLGFDYDDTLLKLANVVKADGIPGNFKFGTKAVWLNSENFNGNGTFLRLTFEVRGNATLGDTSVVATYSPGDVLNLKDKELEFQLIPGTVTILECDHEGRGPVTVPATCAAAGWTCADACPFCKKCFIDEVTPIPLDPDAHNWGPWEDCEDDENHQHTCLNEGCPVGTAKEAHIWDDGEVSDEATCAVPGTKDVVCTVCEAEAEIEYTDPDAHDWGEWEDCQDGLNHKHTCQNDGCPVGTAMEAHTWDNGEITTPPTCQVEGVKTYNCTVCGATKTENLGFGGHTYGEPTWNWNEDYSVATATFTCKENDSTVEVKDENPGTVDVSAATCTADKVIKYTAEVTQNDTKYSTESDPVTVPNTAGHTYGDFVNPVPADCGNDGTLGYYQCSVCQKYFDADKKELESIVDPATGNHTPVPTVAQDATCTADGNDAYWTCSVCGKFFSDEACTAEIAENSWVIGKLGHSFTNYVSDNNATCTEDGTKTAKCDRCEVTDTIADPGTKTGHTFGEWVVDVAATCEANGHRYRICEKDSFKEEEVIPATGHKDDDKDNICDVCSKDLTPENTCEYCGEVHEGFFGKITYFFHKLILKVKNMFGDFSVGHVHNYDAVVTPPTCEGYGYTTYTCKICGRVYIGDYTEPAGHSYDVWYTDVEATCTTEGHQYAVCTVCQQRAEQTIPTSAAHVDANGDGVCDICGKSEVCPYCGETHEGLLGGLYKLVHVLLYKLANLF